MKTVAPFFLLFLVFCAACTQTSLPDLPTESPTAPFVLQDTPAPLLTVEPFQATRRVNQTQNASYLLTSIAVNTQSAISKGTQDAINRFTEAAYPPTLTLFPSLTFTPSPSFTPPPSPTPNPIFVEAIASKREIEDMTWFLSPNGEWTARIIEQLCIVIDQNLEDYSLNYHSIKLFRTDETESWHVLEKITECWSGYSSYSGVSWTLDSSHFYYAFDGITDDCMVVRETSIYQTNVNDKSVKTINHVTGWSLSPDKTKLVYALSVSASPKNHVEIIIVSLDDLSEHRVVVDKNDVNATGLIWSPDSNSILFTLVPTHIYCNEDKPTTIIRMEVQNLEQTVLLENDPRLLITSNWPEKNLVILRGIYPTVWEWNLVTGEFTPSE